MSKKDEHAKPGAAGAHGKGAEKAPEKPESGGAEAEAVEKAPRGPLLKPLRGVKDLWQIPVLLAAVGVIGVGLSRWSHETPGPDFEGAIESTHELIERRDYEGALKMINTVLGPGLDDPQATEDVHKQYYLLAGDALYYLQRQRNLDLPENASQIIEQYTTARREYEAELDGQRLFNLADSLITVGRTQDALIEMRQITGDAAKRRWALLKRVIEKNLDAEVPEFKQEQILSMLSELRDTEGIPASERLWAVTKSAEMRLAAGYPEETIRRLLPEVQRLDSPLGVEAGRLMVILGRAYYAIDDHDEAKRLMSLAEGILHEGDPALAVALTTLGRISQAADDFEEARDRYIAVTSRYASSPMVVEASTGLGEVEADLGRFDESRRAYAEAVRAARNPKYKADATAIATIDASIAQRHRERFLKEDYANALAFATLIEALYPSDRKPADALFRTAETHLRLADQLVGEARLPDGSIDFAKLDPDLSHEIRRHYAEAAKGYRGHYSIVLVTDAEKAADSLWTSADCSDRAGDQTQAIASFQEFIESRPTGDSRQLDAKYRVARALQARGEYRAAISLFEAIKKEKPNTDEAMRGAVPLSQCYLLASDDADWEKAETELLSVLNGLTLQPSSPMFRAALIELGQMYRQVGKYTQAIERITDALQRYPDLESNPDTLFDLADSYRLSAAEIRSALREGMPQSKRQELEPLERERLRNALDLYERVRVDLENQDPRRLSELEKVLLRNAMFYRGDCAYDLGVAMKDDSPEAAGAFFDQAIRHYDSAAQRYSDDPSSLVAMIQIVNCYAAQSKWREARTAHERARARLAELPPDSWDSDTSPMRREHWERWLEASVRLEEGKQAAAGGSGPG